MFIVPSRSNSNAFYIFGQRMQAKAKPLLKAHTIST